MIETDEQSEDIRAIEALIDRQFASLDWTPDTPAHWETFAADFFPEASLYPSARPARRQTVEGFIDRMKGLAGTQLRSFHETVLGTAIHVFGNIAVAVAANEISENDGQMSRSVEMLLLVKTEGEWKIVAQAWDPESPSKRIPAHLFRRHQAALYDPRAGPDHRPRSRPDRFFWSDRSHPRIHSRVNRSGRR